MKKIGYRHPPGPAIQAQGMAWQRCRRLRSRLGYQTGSLLPRPAGSPLIIGNSSRPDNVQPVASPNDSRWSGFWTAVDVSAWLGTVGAGVAFLLTQEALLIGGPIVLPLIALYASQQRGRIQSRLAQVAIQRQVAATLRQFSDISEEAAADVADEIAAMVDEVRSGRAVNDEEAIQRLEAKFTTVEGSIRSVGEATAEALREAATQRSRAVKELSSVLGALRRDVMDELKESRGDEQGALGRMGVRLQALEGAIVGLEATQSEALRRLGSSIIAAMAEREDVVAEAVRGEMWRSMEAVRKLPEALAAVGPEGQNVTAALIEDAVRSVMAEQVPASLRELLDQQRELILETFEEGSVSIDPKQWNQLGKKLVAIDEQLASLKTATSSAVELPSSMTMGQQSATSEEDLARLDAINNKLDELSGALRALQYQILERKESPPSTTEAIVDTAAVIDPVPPLPSSSTTNNNHIEVVDAYRTMQSLLQGAGNEGDLDQRQKPAQAMPSVSTGGNEEVVSEQQAAYNRMQGLLHEDPNRQPADSQDDAPVAISDWLDGNPSRFSSPPKAVGVGSSRNTVLIGEQIAFEAGLAIGDDIEDVGNDIGKVSSMAGSFAESNGDPLDVESNYRKGLEFLRKGRALATENKGLDGLEAAEATLGDAVRCLEAVEAAEPNDIKALGNCGNALMALGRVKAQLAEFATVEDMERSSLLLREAEELLVVAGRRYREVLRIDPSQGRAFLNWGRAICVRAELLRRGGEITESSALFCNAAEKFEAALDVGVDPKEAMRMAGTALLNAAELMDQMDNNRQQILEDAEGFLAAVVESAKDDDVREKLEACQRLLRRGIT